MTYEPGTSDIFTTDEPTAADEDTRTDYQVLANLMRRILNRSGGYGIETAYTEGPEAETLLELPATRLWVGGRELSLLLSIGNSFSRHEWDNL